MTDAKVNLISESLMVLSEIGRAISTANAKTIRDCVKAMQDALTKISPLLADEVDEADSVEEALAEATKILAQMDSYDSIRRSVQDAIRKRALNDSLTKRLASGDLEGYDDDYYSSYPYIRDMYTDYVVYTLGGSLYQCEYKVTKDNVELGDPTPVEVSYVPVTNKQEAITMDLTGDLVQLTEKAVREDGSARVKIISPGWGSSGYYSAEVLKRDGPKVFTKGMHMYINHPTEAEAADRPERDLRDLAGVIASDVLWEDASSKNTGPGLYADVKIFSQFRDFIDQAAPHIGTSIRAAGLAKEGEAEGRRGVIVDSLKEGFSVDYVTYPGRGGEILSLYESARKRFDANEAKLLLAETTDNSVQQTNEVKNVVDISAEELDALKAGAAKASSLEENLNKAIGTIGTLQEALVLSDARVIVNETLSQIEMPKIVREKLRESCLVSVPLTESRSLDRDKLVERVKDAATNELKYIEAVTGSVTGGRVIGMSQPISTELKAEDVDKELQEAWASFGNFNEAEAKIAAAGRN